MLSVVRCCPPRPSPVLPAGDVYMHRGQKHLHLIEFSLHVGQEHRAAKGSRPGALLGCSAAQSPSCSHQRGGSQALPLWTADV